MVVWEGMAVCNATAAGSLAGTDRRHKEGRGGGGGGARGLRQRWGPTACVT